MIFWRISAILTYLFLTKTNDFLTVSNIKGIDTNVPTVILVYDDILVTYLKLVFGLLRVLGAFDRRTALKMVFIDFIK